MELLCYRGQEILSILPQLAHLRIEVFREWPYLYDGSLEYEQIYLSHLAASPGSFCVMASLQGEVVGAATAGLLEAQDEDFQAPIRQAGHLPEDCLYCGESVLLKSYRGLGLGHRFFDAREEHGRSWGRTLSVFCRVVRPPEHPLRPRSARSLDEFWRRRGYAPLEGVWGQYSWKDIDSPEESFHPMEYWMRRL